MNSNLTKEEMREDVEQGWNENGRKRDWRFVRLVKMESGRDEREL